jgi:hypothetical protein
VATLVHKSKHCDIDSLSKKTSHRLPVEVGPDLAKQVHQANTISQERFGHCKLHLVLLDLQDRRKAGGYEPRMPKMAAVLKTVVALGQRWELSWMQRASSHRNYLFKRSINLIEKLSALLPRESKA